MDFYKDYYKIKITSEVDRKEFILQKEEKALLSSIGIVDKSSFEWDKEFNDCLSQLKKEHEVFLHFHKDKGFTLVRESRGDIFTEELIKNDVLLQEYLKDKQYELVKVSDVDRFHMYGGRSE